MLVHELIELLQEADAGQEVRLAFQPHWPLAFQISHTFDAAEAFEDEDEECMHKRVVCDICEFDGTCEIEPMFWIVQGDHPDGSPYGVPKGVWEG